MIDRKVCRSAVAMALAMMVIGGCATAYRPENANGGYSETRLDANVFRVTFKGNVRMNQADTNEMALLRAAEVTLQNGYGYFVTSGAAPTGSAMSLATNVVSIPATTLTISCFTTRPEGAAMAHDARAIVETIGPKYIKPKL